MVWEVSVGGDSLCRGGVDGAGACRPAWGECALRTVPSRYCKQFVSQMGKAIRMLTIYRELQNFREDLRHLYKYFHLFKESRGNYELIITYFIGKFLLIISADIKA